MPKAVDAPKIVKTVIVKNSLSLYLCNILKNVAKIKATEAMINIEPIINK